MTYSRIETRKGFNDTVRLTLLEQDADNFETLLRSSIDAMRATQRQLIGVGITILVSIIGALAFVAFH